MSQISVNPKHRNDPYHRYKMPAVKSKITNRGNGTFTTIENMLNISESLYHPDDILFKFISYDLATCCDFKKKTLKGAYKNDVIQDSLDKYISYFVLCHKCSIPETTAEIEGKKKKAICKMDCMACGTLSKLDSKDKLLNKTIQLIIKDKQSGRKWKEHKKIYEDLNTVFSFDDFQ